MINTLRFSSLVKSALIKALTEQHKLVTYTNEQDIAAGHKAYFRDIDQINSKADKEILDWYLGEVYIDETTIGTMLHQLNADEQLPF